MPTRCAISVSRPSEIVRVWLIAVSIFQRAEGRCSWRAIEISDREQACPVV